MAIPTKSWTKVELLTLLDTRDFEAKQEIQKLKAKHQRDCDELNQLIDEERKRNQEIQEQNENLERLITELSEALGKKAQGHAEKDAMIRVLGARLHNTFSALYQQEMVIVDTKTQVEILQGQQEKKEAS